MVQWNIGFDAVLLVNLRSLIIYAQNEISMDNYQENIKLLHTVIQNVEEFQLMDKTKKQFKSLLQVYWF